MLYIQKAGLKENDSQQWKNVYCWFWHEFLCHIISKKINCKQMILYKCLHIIFRLQVSHNAKCNTVPWKWKPLNIDYLCWSICQNWPLHRYQRYPLLLIESNVAPRKDVIVMTQNSTNSYRMAVVSQHLLVITTHTSCTHDQIHARQPAHMQIHLLLH